MISSKQIETVARIVAAIMVDSKWTRFYEMAARILLSRVNPRLDKGGPEALAKSAKAIADALEKHSDPHAKEMMSAIQMALESEELTRQ